MRAGEPSPVWKDGWTINVPGASNWVSDGAPSPFALQHTPCDALRSRLRQGPVRVRRLFDRTHASASTATMGLAMSRRRSALRMSEPLAATVSRRRYDPRRYLGVGPRMGFEGNKALPSSWVVEWHVGAALLSGNRTFDSNGGVANSVLPN